MRRPDRNARYIRASVGTRARASPSKTSSSGGVQLGEGVPDLVVADELWKQPPENEDEHRDHDDGPHHPSPQRSRRARGLRFAHRYPRVKEDFSIPSGRRGMCRGFATAALTSSPLSQGSAAVSHVGFHAPARQTGLVSGRGSHDAAEAEKAGRGVGGLGLACCGAVLQAVGRCTQVRGGPDHQPIMPPVGNNAPQHGRPSGAPHAKDAEGWSADVEQAVSVRWERRDGRGAIEAVEHEVLVRETAGVLHEAPEPSVGPGCKRHNWAALAGLVGYVLVGAIAVLIAIRARGVHSALPWVIGRLGALGLWAAIAALLLGLSLYWRFPIIPNKEHTG